MCVCVWLWLWLCGVCVFIILVPGRISTSATLPSYKGFKLCIYKIRLVVQSGDGADLKSHLQIFSGSEPHRKSGSEGFGGTVGKAGQSVWLSPSEGLSGQGA